MSDTLRLDTERLLDSARDAYAEDPEALQVVEGLAARLRDPLRVAVAGMVKAGKSTLLNALLGEQIAPTDAGECTRVVTWYRWSATPTVTMHTADGPQRLPVRRERGRLVIDLGVPAESVEWIDVGWPSPGLKSMILIDTPGIASLTADASARAAAFLAPDDAPTEADAVLYLMRHLHASDVRFLEAFRDHAAGMAQSTSAVGILSRADEVGSGRIHALLSASKVARRYEQHEDVESLVLGVIPVAGLVAEGARTLREHEYAAFRLLADLERDERELLLMSADRFTGSRRDDLTQERRTALLDRFGMFGVRLATALIRGGAQDSTELSEQLVQHSGLVELQQVVRDHLRTRTTALKARGVLAGLARLVHDRPGAGADALRAGIERLEANAHQLRELALLETARVRGLPLSEDDAAEAQMIVGGEGTPTHVRLGVPDTATPSQRRERTIELQDRWRGIAESPLTEHAAVAVCRVVLRSLDEIGSEVAARDDDLAAAHVVPAG